MTLQQFFNIISDNPSIVLFYYIALPLTAFLIGLFAGTEGYKSPWKFVYSALIYLALVPGIFALMLNVYLFLFERMSILDMNLYTQVLPIIGMIVVILLITRKVDLRYIPGFDRMSGLVLLVFIVLLIMWVLDRTRVFAVTFLPFPYVILLLIGVFVALRYAIRSVFK